MNANGGQGATMANNIDGPNVKGGVYEQDADGRAQIAARTFFQSCYLYPGYEVTVQQIDFLLHQAGRAVKNEYTVESLQAGVYGQDATGQAQIAAGTFFQSLYPGHEVTVQQIDFLLYQAGRAVKNEYTVEHHH